MDDMVAGGVVSTEPLVTYSRGDACIAGIAQCYPELFRGRRALHFLGFNRAVDRPLAERLAVELAALERELGDNRFVIMANEEYEAVVLGSVGLPVFTSSHVIFLDEGTFRPYPPPDRPTRRFDAVYNARFETYKRHELARDIKSLMLIYAINGGGLPVGIVREMLPQAYFANHERGGGKYAWLSWTDIAALSGACSVGLCLSANEGAMRAAMEYLMCGLMVVSTDSLGGRGRYLAEPYARIVKDDPEAVARGVAELVAAPVHKGAVRDHIGRIVSFERLAFLALANRIAKEQFGIDGVFKSAEPFIKCGNDWRRASVAVAPLRAAPVAASAGRSL